MLLVQRADAVPADEAWLAAAERARADSFPGEARRRDFRLGRWTAKRALADRLGLERSMRALCEIEVASDEQGAPRATWRGAAVPCALSLSHRDGAALCALAPAGVALGCDLERLEARSAAFAEHFLADVERAALTVLPDTFRGEHATLLWSAKESALKALGIGLRVDARDVVVHTDPAHPRAGAWRPLRVRGSDVPSLCGWWCVRLSWILTVVADVPLDPPRFRPQPARIAPA